jgi:hypothetical protein
MAMAVNESLKVVALSRKLLSAPSNSDHFAAVQAQCGVAIELHGGVLQLVDTKNGLAAFAVVRSLFETVIGAVILANHPEKLQDFGTFGRMTLLRLARSIADGTLAKKQMTVTLKAAADAEYDALYKSFKPTKNWHKMIREDAFNEAFQGAKIFGTFYDGFYGRTSAIAHGEPFNVFRHLDAEAKTWKIEVRPTEWKEKWPLMAETMSDFLMLHLVERISKTFALGLEAEWTVLNAEVEAFAGQQMAPARALPDVK